MKSHPVELAMYSAARAIRSAWTITVRRRISLCAPFWSESGGAWLQRLRRCARTCWTLTSPQDRATAEGRLCGKENKTERRPLRVGCVGSTPREADIERPSAPVRGARRPSGEDCESADEASPTISGVAVDRRPAHGLLDADLGLLAVLVLLGEDAGTTSWTMRWVPPSQVPTTWYPVDRFFGTIFSGGCWTPASARRFSIDFRTSAHIGGALRAAPAPPPMRRATATAVGLAHLAPLEPSAIARRCAAFVVRAITAVTKVAKRVSPIAESRTNSLPAQKQG